jgi:hypothetical protein
MSRIFKRRSKIFAAYSKTLSSLHFLETFFPIAGALLVDEKNPPLPLCVYSVVMQTQSEQSRIREFSL